MANLLENNIEGSIVTQKCLCTISWHNEALLMDKPEMLEDKILGLTYFQLFWLHLQVVRYQPCECISIEKDGIFLKLIFC